METALKHVGVDFDATLATYDGWKGPAVLGKPVPEMVRRMKAGMAQGTRFWIFTARVNPSGHDYKSSLDATQSYVAIAQWCMQVFGQLLPITHEKNQLWQEVWDDRAIQVLPNTGVFATDLLTAHGAHR